MTNYPFMVDVVMTTYNHEKYIKQAIEGVLIQRADFKIRLNLYNDASTDSTHDIILEAITNTNSKIIINYINHVENLGIAKNGILAFNNCTAKYIAICEGDDYWTDPLKLQKQVDFLEEEPEYGMVATYYDQYFQEESKLIETKFCPPMDIFLNDILLGNPVGTLTVLFRMSFMPAFLQNIEIGIKESWQTGDYPNWIKLASSSKIKIMPIKTAVYRVLLNSASSRHSQEKLVTFEKSVLDVQHYFINKYLNGEEKGKFIEITNKRFLNKMYDLNIVDEYNTTLSRLKSMGYKFSTKEKVKSIVLNVPFIKRIIRKI